MTDGLVGVLRGWPAWRFPDRKPPHPDPLPHKAGGEGAGVSARVTADDRAWQDKAGGEGAGGFITLGQTRSASRIVLPILVGFLGAVGEGLERRLSAAEPMPNVIVFLADDMGIGDTSAYQDWTGNSDDQQLATPQMERLARCGVRFTDAHTSSSRCTTTRYALLTGRYAWRSRLKWWVLFGAQGDPLIEPDRPTIASMLRDAGYHTGMVGKWHVGLRYRRSDGTPAADFDDADLTQPLWDTPLDHGFDFAAYTSRSHGTSGPAAGTNRNQPLQSVGPGHLLGRTVESATNDGRKLTDDGPSAYVLEQLGGRHSDRAITFMTDHLRAPTQSRPFLLYYAANANHSPYTPDDEIGGTAVRGAARTKSGKPMGPRYDFVHENDVALGRLLDFLDEHDDPRNPGKKLSDNTIVVFSSDNGAEIAEKAATGPLRSHKGSAYEGGHRVPFLVTWPAGGVGDGDERTPGRTDASLIGLHDLYATFAEIVAEARAGESMLPNLARGEKGAEDSQSRLAAWRGETSTAVFPLFHHDHKEADDPAASAIRVNDPLVEGRVWSGQWKLFFDASLLRAGLANPTELYELQNDPTESDNRLDDPQLRPLVGALTSIALKHRTSGGHRMASLASDERVAFDWRSLAGDDAAANRAAPSPALGLGGIDSPVLTQAVAIAGGDRLTLTLRAVASPGGEPSLGFDLNGRGLGVRGGRFDQVDDGEAIELAFDRDVIIESVSIVAGNGVCGGFYRVGDDAPIQIYCVDADIDARDQSGNLSDLGVLLRGESLRLDSSPFLGVESPGQWRLGAVHVRLLSNLP